MSVAHGSVADAPAGAATARLKITEIFLSLQGETTLAGLPTVFVRLTGCPLRCQYCDTAYAFHGGTWRTLDEIIDAVCAYGIPQVCVTGGEPLAQRAAPELLRRLCDEGFRVSLETSGAIDIAAVDARVARIIDIKTPGSGEESRNRWDNLALLNAHDQLKFVICSRADYEWSKAKLLEWPLAERCEVLFSPSFAQVSGRELAEWIIADRLPVRFQLQLHKILWGDEPGR